MHQKQYKQRKQWRRKNSKEDWQKNSNKNGQERQCKGNLLERCHKRQTGLNLGNGFQGVI